VNLLVQEIRSDRDALVGESPALARVRERIAQVAPTDSTVLIQGETGTGKELVARAIHEQSARRERPLVKVNCAALPRELVESELFGHEKGAFTGALQQRRGRFELADGGSMRRPSCCACCRSKSSSASAARAACARMSG
jgi:transcriptional regulator with GAF, ATPase, and Fis domain